MGFFLQEDYPYHQLAERAPWILGSKPSFPVFSFTASRVWCKVSMLPFNTSPIELPNLAELKNAKCHEVGTVGD